MTNKNTRQILYEKSAGYRFDAALYRSTLIHHTPEFYVKPEQRSFCSAQNPASFGVKLAYGVVFAGNPPKEKVRNFS